MVQLLYLSYPIDRRPITFGPKRNEVTGEWRKLHKKKLHNLHLVLLV